MFPISILFDSTERLNQFKYFRSIFEFVLLEALADIQLQDFVELW